MEIRRDKRKLLKVSTAALAGLLVLGGALYYLISEEKKEGELYSPTVAVPEDFMVIVEYPGSEEDMLAISCLTPLLFMGGNHHPLIVLDRENELSRQELFTLSHWRTDRQKMFFGNGEGTLSTVNSQLSDAGLSTVEEFNAFPLTTDICASFIGFAGAMTVSTYEESLWVATHAKRENLAMIQGRATFGSQEDAWERLASAGVSAEYVVVTNPNDHNLAILKNQTMDYDDYDDPWFCPDLSVISSVLCAYHDGYMITDTPSVGSVEWDLNMEFPQNRRAAGLLSALRDMNLRFGPTENIALVGCASAIPQFLLQVNNEGAITNSDVIYGFLDDDDHTMDAAVGRIIQYDLSLASNQLAKTFMFDDFVDTVHVNYRDVAGGSHEKEWRKHGASFSGFEITYERMQATPGRWICTDFEDAGFTYDYVGPYGTGTKLADGTVNSMENDISEICRGSGYVAYRGHGSDYGSLYGIRVYGPNGDEHTLSSADAAAMDVPPQIAYFVSCLNGKIYGHGPGTDPGSDIDFERLFTLNYLASGPAVLIGATEVSYSNIGQDLTSIPAEYLPFSDDHQWDHNDAWYAFVWDGILDHPGEHGTAGKAVQWSENRYMKYPANNNPTPFNPDGSVDWFEVTFFALYGDPAFRPAIDPDTKPNYDPWHNGADDN